MSEKWYYFRLSYYVSCFRSRSSYMSESYRDMLVVPWTHLRLPPDVTRP